MVRMIHRLLVVLLCGLTGLQTARTQFIPGGLFEREQGSVLIKVLEQGTDNPIPYASAYLTA